MKKRYSEERIIGFLQEADAGLTAKDLCRRHRFSEASYYLWCTNVALSCSSLSLANPTRTPTLNHSTAGFVTNV